jgi:predicted transcriptional regulator
MLLSEISGLLGCETIDGFEQLLGIEIGSCFAADLMSEVLAFCGHGALLITGLTNIQSVHTADVADLRAILYVNDKRPEAAVIALARDRGIPLLSTKLTMFGACGILYNQGLKPAWKR